MDFLKSYVSMGFPGGSGRKKPACHAGDPHFIPGWEDPLEKGMATHSSVLYTYLYLCTYQYHKYIYISTHTHIYIAHIFVSDGKHVGSFWKNPQHTFNRWFLLERA